MHWIVAIAVVVLLSGSAMAQKDKAKGKGGGKPEKVAKTRPEKPAKAEKAEKGKPDKAEKVEKGKPEKAEKSKPEKAEGGGRAWHFTTKDGNFNLWLPAGKALVKGIFVFPFYGTARNFSEYSGLRAMSSDISCAIVGFNAGGKLADGTPVGMPGHDKSPASVLLDALAELARLSGHPEVKHAPLLTFGHSNATVFSAGFASKVPERVFGWIAFKSAFGALFSKPKIYNIPGMVISGENDASYFGDQLATVLRLRREHGALMHMIVEPGAGHWPNGTKTYTILMAFMKAAFLMRVPADSNATAGPVKLIACKESDGWLGRNVDAVRVRQPKFTWKWERPVDIRQRLEIGAYGEFPCDKTRASWLPGEDYARKWQEFCELGVVADYAEVRPSTGIESMAGGPLAPQVKRLASAHEYKPILDELRKIAGEAGAPERAAEAAEIIRRVEARGIERVAQAERLEVIEPPCAESAWQDLAARYAGTTIGDLARRKLKDKSFQVQLRAWARVDEMKRAEEKLHEVPGAQRVAGDAKFAKANAQPLKDMADAAADLLAHYPQSRAAAPARIILERYKIQLPKIK